MKKKMLACALILVAGVMAPVNKSESLSCLLVKLRVACGAERIKFVWRFVYTKTLLHVSSPAEKS